MPKPTRAERDNCLWGIHLMRAAHTETSHASTFAALHLVGQAWQTDQPLTSHQLRHARELITAMRAVTKPERKARGS